MTQTKKITPSDVLAQLSAMRTIVDTLPDAAAGQRASLQTAIDTTISYVRQALPKPGTYVTAGGAAAMAGIAAVVGAVGGGLVGHKLGKSAAPPKALPAASAHESSAEEDEVVIAAIAAEAVRKARAKRQKTARVE
jgi:hypothetical protein